MSANYSDPAPDAGNGSPPQPVQPEPMWIESSLPIDPLQPLREYPTSGPWTIPPRPLTPQNYPVAGTYQPGWPPYPGQQAQPWQAAPTPYPGYQNYPGYGYYPGYYPWPPQPARPKRDGYHLAIAITAFICSCFVIMGGLASIVLMAVIILAQNSLSGTSSSSANFQAILTLLGMGVIGIAGGSFCIYHCVRTLFLHKPSSALKLPRFWIFLLFYIATLGLGYWVQTQTDGVTAATGLLIFMGAIFPALAILALGIRRLRGPQAGSEVTSWRRFTLALISGATLSILLASVIELVLELLLFNTQSNTLFSYLSDPSSSNPDPAFYGVLLTSLAVIAPLVEELVKPLAVVVLIGRINSKAEAFALGLACGIGFNLVETTGYISSGYSDWLNVALIRSGAGLLHGFGAGMVALGWYCLTHKTEGTWTRRILLAVGCGGYAVIQHALWNGAVGLALLPGPIGTFFQTWIWNFGPFTIQGTEFVNIIEMIGILIFFIFMSGRLRPKTVPSTGQTQQPGQPQTIAQA